MKKSNSLFKLEQAALSFFENAFKETPDILVGTPGRINIIGEHTDYNQGFVFPCAINKYTIVAAKKRNDNEIHILTEKDPDHEIVFSVEEHIPKDLKTHLWSNYVRGVIQTLVTHPFAIRGANITVSGNLPLGAGLSSSASLEVSIAKAILTLYDHEIDNKTLAKICQSAENNYVGCKCGIMDQYAVIFGKKDHALLIDCLDDAIQEVPLPENLHFIIINSNIKHRLTEAGYNDRIHECQQVKEAFNITSLRKLSKEVLINNFYKINDTLYRRALHTIEENRRVIDLVSALENKNNTTLFNLIGESHTSLQRNYEVTIPETDTLVTIANQALKQEGRSRMVGGGFGGSIIALTDNESIIKSVQSMIQNTYPAIFGKQADIYLCNATDGAFLSSSI